MRTEGRKSSADKRMREWRMVYDMIALYCRRHHPGQPGALCPACRALADYARARIEQCPFMDTKTFCSSCSRPCYRPDRRAQMKAVMRFSGPRMLLYHPVQALRHAADGLKRRGRMKPTKLK